MSLPFKEVLLESNSMYDKVLREFSKDLSNEELNWHRDKEDRLVEVKKGSGWYLQMENEIPVLMSEGLKFHINENIPISINIYRRGYDRFSM